MFVESKHPCSARAVAVDITLLDHMPLILAARFKSRHAAVPVSRASVVPRHTVSIYRHARTPDLVSWATRSASRHRFGATFLAWFVGSAGRNHRRPLHVSSSSRPRLSDSSARPL